MRLFDVISILTLCSFNWPVSFFFVFTFHWFVHIIIYSLATCSAMYCEKPKYSMWKNISHVLHQHHQHSTFDLTVRFFFLSPRFFSPFSLELYALKPWKTYYCFLCRGEKKEKNCACDRYSFAYMCVKSHTDSFRQWIITS